MIVDGHCHIQNDYKPILSRMDELGIDKTVLVGVGVSDLSVVTIRDSFVFRSDILLKTLGVMKAKMLVCSRKLRNALLKEPVNGRVLDAIKACPDRFIGFVFVNPESDNALLEIERCLNQGMRGIKLALLQYPTDLSGEKMTAICEIAQERGVPVFFHQGLTRESSDALCMVDRFRKVNFIIAHAGVQYFEQALSLAMAHDNVFIDTSSYMVTFSKLKHLYKKLGAGKLIFGTDVPVMSRDPEEGLSKINRLAASQADKDRIFGLNLMEILDKGGKKNYE